MSDDNQTLKIVTRICITVAIIAALITGGCTYIRHRAFSEGYEEVMLPGNSMPTWAKKQP